MTGLRVPGGAPQAAQPGDGAAPGPAVPPARRPSPFGVTGWARWGWRQLTSMRTALVLLFLLAVVSVPGSLLPQQGIDPAAVQQYYVSHPALAPWLARLSLFNVFAAPWFAAIYLLLFLSLAGCVIPRSVRLARSARTPPPPAPRNLARLPSPPGTRAPSIRRTPSPPPPPCCAAASSGCGPVTAGCRPRRATAVNWATWCSTSRCSHCCARWRWAGCSATRPTGCWSAGPRSRTR